MMDLVSLITTDLYKDEGKERCVYKDSRGYQSIGVGFLVDPSVPGAGLFDNEIDFILRNRINIATLDIQNEPWYKACDTDNRRRALVNMRYQLGGAGIRSFTTFLGLVTNQKWIEAGDDLRTTAWYHQTPNRAERVIFMLQVG